MRTFAGCCLALLVACGACRNGNAAPAAKSPSASPEARRVRPPAAAGSFYPGEPDQLAAAVRAFLAKAPKVAQAPVRIVLAPHAGFPYSGQVAANAMKQLAPGFTRAVVVAGNHDGRADFEGVSVDRATHYAMPGFEVKVAKAAEELAGRPGFVDVPLVHGMHMIEIELPFLREVNGAPFELVPLIVGRLTREGTRAVAAELARLADPKTVFVFSLDMSHYHPYAVAMSLDRPCLAALERMDAEDVAGCDTDATQVLLIMTELAAMQAQTPRIVTYANSGDVSADKSRVVGYGALVYEDRFELRSGEQAALLRLARQSLESAVKEGRNLAVPPEVIARNPRLGVTRGTFVTLRKGGDLRGCIGTLEARDPLALDVIRNAVRAGLQDPRFPAVRPDELASLRISISALDAPRPLEKPAGEDLVRFLRRNRPGLVLSYQGRRSTFLPMVWEELPEPEEFLGHLCQKQGSPEECWRDRSARFEAYGAQELGERP